VWVAGQVKLSDPLTGAILGALEMSFMIKHYTNLRQIPFIFVP